MFADGIAMQESAEGARSPCNQWAIIVITAAINGSSTAKSFSSFAPVDRELVYF